jgi:hypothetical protein
MQTGAETQIHLKGFITDLQEDASEVQEFNNQFFRMLKTVPHWKTKRSQQELN